MRFLAGPGDPGVAVIGLGYVGSCVAATLASRGFEVVGVDTDAGLVDELNRGNCPFHERGLADALRRAVSSGRLRATTDSAELARAEVVLIGVGTPVRSDGSLADDQLRAACQQVSRHLRPGQLVVLKSTVPPGTTRDLVLPLLERSGLTGEVDFGLAFTPERFAEGTALYELHRIPIVAGALGPDSARAVTGFWRQTLGVEVVSLESLESAEIVKLADNWWIDLNIALANELARFCALYDVDVLDVIAAANTIPKGQGRVNILLPSVGVGGSCLTKDPWMVWRSARGQGVEIRTAQASRATNDAMPDYTGQLILDELARLGRPPSTARVAVLGLAFKNNTGDLRATPVRAVVEKLIEAGTQVRLYDPLVDPDQGAELFGTGLAADLSEAVEGADCIAVLALHQAFETIDFAALPVRKPCLILDGRAYYPRLKVAELTRLGYVYRGIGRPRAVPSSLGGAAVEVGAGAEASW